MGKPPHLWTNLATSRWHIRDVSWEWWLLRQWSTEPMLATCPAPLMASPPPLLNTSDLFSAPQRDWMSLVQARDTWQPSGVDV